MHVPSGSCTVHGRQAYDHQHYPVGAYLLEPCAVMSSFAGEVSSKLLTSCCIAGWWPEQLITTDTTRTTAGTCLLMSQGFISSQHVHALALLQTYASDGKPEQILLDMHL